MSPRSRHCLLAPFAACALFALACPGTPPAAPHAAPSPPPPRPLAPAVRVLLLSLDGAGSEALHQLYAEGVLDAGGFARFFREGQVATGLVPVNPTLTAPNHISLATGYPAGSTGIVSNRFHPPGAAWGVVMSGFDAPIATETLWEAARRQGKRVGSIAWPGTDGRDDRRRADWGMLYSSPDRKGGVVTLRRRDWAPAEIPPGTRFPASYAPVLAAHLDLPDGRPGEGFDLSALDSADDGVVRYDRLLVLPRQRPAGTPIPPPPSIVPLAAGQWGALLSAGAPEGATSGLWIKVLAIDSGLATVRLYFGSTNHTRAYPESFAATLAERGLVWPGAPDEALLRESWQGPPANAANTAGIDLDTWSEQTERFAAFFGGSLRAAAARPDWDLLLGYTPVIDEAGHTLSLLDPRQPGFTPERRDVFAAARLRVWRAVDRELARLLAEVDLSTTRVVVVSDHGMAPVHTVIDPNVLLLGKGYLAVDAKGKILPERSAVIAVSDGGLSHLYLGPRAGADPAAREKVVAALRALFAGWTVDGVRSLARVLTRHEAAEVGLDHPASGDLVLFAQEGYAFQGRGDLRERHAAVPTDVYGMHGYLNGNADMHAIYMVLGVGIQPGTRSPLSSTEVAGLVAQWLGIERPRPVSPQALPAPPRPPAAASTPAGSPGETETTPKTPPKL
jgi:predicted AlkP superfamily pyrophosphatase or phosphodiesterase